MNHKLTKDFEWQNKPKEVIVHTDRVLITTEPKTDLWQQTYYGFQKVNAPAFLRKVVGDFTFQVKTEYKEAINMYDQCGVLCFFDDENWIKVSVEYENDAVRRLGSVATNLGYSDWASVDIPGSTTQMWYRLSRRGKDFFIESSEDGTQFQQMRMLHMHKSKETARVGIYACSPMDSSFKAVFSEIKIGTCLWETH
nr:DUF1349 domain-containing protein [uncultured Draconibacterium sp.]